ncbi:Predicted methyltransferase regulatory domain-containing protein [Desulfonatronum zhilinae]|nr:Predicted methyltransferase regulatory domain-containing protein [Desulfonatronum zhilinae]
MQKLLQRHQQAKGLSPMAAIDKGFDFMTRLGQSQAALFSALPQLSKRIEETIKKDKSYLIQEYLHENWHPLWFSQVCSEMGQAKLSFAASATLPENYLPAMLPEPMRNLVTEHDDPIFAQEVIDCQINQAFRRDIFQRGAYRPWPANQNQSLLQAKFMLMDNPKDFEIKTTFGSMNGKTEVYQPIIEALAQGPKKIAQLEGPLVSTIQALTMLLNKGCVAPASEKHDLKSVMRFNRAVTKAATEGAPYNYLACARINSGISVSTPNMMLLDALTDKTPHNEEALATVLATKLSAIGRNLVVEGKTLTDPQEIKAETSKLAREFLKTFLPQYKNLGVWE